MWSYLLTRTEESWLYSCLTLPHSLSIQLLSYYMILTMKALESETGLCEGGLLSLLPLCTLEPKWFLLS